jgi:hypothetical protein
VIANGGITHTASTTLYTVKVAFTGGSGATGYQLYLTNQFTTTTGRFLIGSANTGATFVTGGLLLDLANIVNTFTVVALFATGERASNAVAYTITTTTPTPTPVTGAGIRYALLIAGQSNSHGQNLDSDIQPFGLDVMEPTSAEHPYSRLVMVGTDYVANPFGGGQILNGALKGVPTRAANPSPNRGLTRASGVNFGFHCGKELLKKLKPADEVWLLNVGWAGSTMRTNVDVKGFGSWDPNFTAAGGGDKHFVQAVSQFKAAMQTHNLKPLALLWHQGESDCSTPEIPLGYNPSYAAQLWNSPDSVFKRIRTELQLPLFPIVCGMLRETVYNANALNANIRQAHQGCTTIGNAAVVTVIEFNAFDHTTDIYHFSAAGQRKLGQRYANALLTLTHGMALV